MAWLVKQLFQLENYRLFSIGILVMKFMFVCLLACLIKFLEQQVMKILNRVFISLISLYMILVHKSWWISIFLSLLSHSSLQMIRIMGGSVKSYMWPFKLAEANFLLVLQLWCFSVEWLAPARKCTQFHTFRYKPRPMGERVEAS